MRLRFAVLGLIVLFALGDSGNGCSGSPVGVQDYGSITGRVIDSVDNHPVANALVSVGSLYTVYADRAGAFTIPQVPIGPQTVTVRAAGYDTTAVVAHVRKDQTYSVNYVSLRPTAGGINNQELVQPATPVPTIPPPQIPQQPSPSPAATASP